VASGGVIMGCTMMACQKYDAPECRAYDMKEAEKEVEVPENCIRWYDGCNNCFVSDDDLLACTKKYCDKK